MSAEFFDRLGLIICGQNMEGETEVQIFNSKSNSWIFIKQDNLNINADLNYSFMALKLLSSGRHDEFQLILLGGMNINNKKDRNGAAGIYRLYFEKGSIMIDISGEAKLKGKSQDPVSDYFPQNQWIT